MDKFKYFLGIDISKKTLDYALMDSKGIIILQTSIPNTEKECLKLFGKIEKLGIRLSELLICAEHTGSYLRPLLRTCHRKELNFWMENPLQIRKSLGIQRGKSDAADARRIAEYCWRFRDKASFADQESARLLLLKDLIATRNMLKGTLASLSAHANELKTLDPSASALIERCTKNSKKAIEKDLKDIEEMIHELLSQQEEYKSNYELIQSIPGIGRITAAYLILMTWNFKRLTNPKKLACFAGIAPFSYSSGTSVYAKPRVSNYANKTLKTLLHLGVFNAIRSDYGLKKYFDRKKEEGKPVMSISNAIRNKLIARVCSVIRNQTPYTKENFPAVA